MSFAPPILAAMKIPNRSNGNADGLSRIGRRPPANAEALKVLEEAAVWVRAHPEMGSLVVLPGSFSQCRPYTTVIQAEDTVAVSQNGCAIPAESLIPRARGRTLPFGGAISDNVIGILEGATAGVISYGVHRMLRSRRR